MSEDEGARHMCLQCKHLKKVSDFGTSHGKRLNTCYVCFAESAKGRRMYSRLSKTERINKRKRDLQRMKRSALKPAAAVSEAVAETLWLRAQRVRAAMEPSLRIRSEDIELTGALLGRG